MSNAEEKADRSSTALPHGVVLLSGGLDSSAALVWAGARYADLRAVSFDYGQPNRKMELPAAERIAAARGVPWTRIETGAALETGAGLMGGRFGEERMRAGETHAAFLPGRNFVLISLAAAQAAVWWPEGPIDLIVGACLEDQAGFPDCRPTTLAKFAMALCEGIGREFRVLSPWADRSKAQILYAIRPDAEALSQVLASWSCYRAGPVPCGTCGACVNRAAAEAG